MKITVLCLTTSRDSLARSLRSLKRQPWQPGDEVLLVHDGPDAGAGKLWLEADLPGRFIELSGGPHNDWGHTPRNLTLPEITEGHIVNLDDDDALVPGAIAMLHNVLDQNPEAFHIFRAVWPNGVTSWFHNNLKEGNVGTGTFVMPAAAKRGRYVPRVGGDFDFIAETVALNPDRPVIWRREAHYMIRPHRLYCRPLWVDGSRHGRWSGREDCQTGWHEHFGRRFSGETILDVGAGRGTSRSRLSLGGGVVVTQDVAPGLDVDMSRPVAAISDKSFDVVTAFDVIEHIPDPVGFIRHLARIARGWVVLTTPNIWISRCGNPHHIREHCPGGILEIAYEAAEWSEVEMLTARNWEGRMPLNADITTFLGSADPSLGLVLHAPLDAI